MHRRLRPLLLAAVIPVSLAACGADDRQRTDAPATGDAAFTATIDNGEFLPEKVEVATGQAVAWVWKDDTVHDVAFDDGSASPKQKSGTWQRTFDRPGSFDYVCTLHPNMRGTVVVRHM